MVSKRLCEQSTTHDAYCIGNTTRPLLSYGQKGERGNRKTFLYVEAIKRFRDVWADMRFDDVYKKAVPIYRAWTFRRPAQFVFGLVCIYIKTFPELIFFAPWLHMFWKYPAFQSQMQKWKEFSARFHCKKNSVRSRMKNELLESILRCKFGMSKYDIHVKDFIPPQSLLLYPKDIYAWAFIWKEKHLLNKWIYFQFLFGVSLLDYEVFSLVAFTFLFASLTAVNIVDEAVASSFL